MAMNMNHPLAGRRALICGSTQGIGRATAVELARRGAICTLAARDADALAVASAELERPLEQEHGFITADFKDPAGLRQKIAEHLNRVGVMEILINNSGGPAPGPILEATLDDFQQAFAMHVLCNHVLVQALAPGMKARGYGRIINIISTSVKQPIPGLGVSNTTRWAVAAWAKTLAGELGPFGITVNNVLPGFTATQRLKALFETRARKQNVPIEQVEAAARTEIPAQRFAEPHETAAAIAFLAAPEAAYINGINLPVDGGRLASL